MKKKISTLMDRELYRRVRLESVLRQKQIHQIITEAVESYLRDSASASELGSAVAASWNALPMARHRVEEILEEEDGLLEA